MPGNKKLIAIVDDDPQTRELMSELIAPFSCRTSKYTSGDQLLENLESEVPDLVLLDVMMPGRSGFEVCRILKKKFGDELAVIILTALDDEESKSKGLQAGCDEFLTKPLKLTELKVRVKNLLQMTEMRRQLKKREEISRELLAEKKQDIKGKVKESPHRVLIVEDNPQDQTLLKAFLDDENYELYLVSNGEEALKILGQEEIDLILLDYYLPDYTGIELYHQIEKREKLDELAVIMVTANDDSRAKADCIEAGISDYLIKPVNHLELKARMKSILQSLDSRKELMGDYSRAREKAVKDSLTGLFNNRFFKHFLQREMRDVCQQGDVLSVLMLDLDKFKEYNDTFGHQAGDRVLEDTSRIILKNIRNSDLAARYGGEEFGVVLTATGEDEAYFIAERLRREIEAFSFSGQKQLSRGNLSISIGVAECIPGQSAEELIKLADEALYRVKKRGRNLVIKGSELI